MASSLQYDYNKMSEQKTIVRGKFRTVKIGDVVGDLTVKRRIKFTAAQKKKLKPNQRKVWVCKCSCGNEIKVVDYYLKRDQPKSHCGCQSQSIKTIFKNEYHIFISMNDRCNNPKHRSYADYGGRGIKVCDDWNRYNPEFEDGITEGFTNFLRYMKPRQEAADALNKLNGTDLKAENLSIDRIDVNGNYEPANVRWATSEQQASNRRNTDG